MSDNVKMSVSIENNLPTAEKELSEVLAIWAEATGGDLVNLTHREQPKHGGRGTPVDTGRLRNSMSYAHSDDNKTVYVGTDVEYAEAVEDGARNADYGLGKGVGAHMLRNSVMDCGEQAEKNLKDVLEARE